MPLPNNTTVAVAEVVFGPYLHTPPEALVSTGTRGSENTHPMALYRIPTTNIIVDEVEGGPYTYNSRGVTFLLLSVPVLLWLAHCIALYYL
jgi:hypothetical protein